MAGSLSFHPPKVRRMEKHEGKIIPLPRKKRIISVCAPFFSDYPPKLQERMLADASYRLAHPEILARKLRVVPRRAVSRSVVVASSEMLTDCPDAFNLDDGWWRVVALTKWGGLEVFRGERYKQQWLAHTSKAALNAIGMTRWPHLKTSSNPFRITWIREVAVVQIDYDEGEEEYHFTLHDAPGVTRTFWFPHDFELSDRGRNWLKVRHPSPTIPFNKSSTR